MGVTDGQPVDQTFTNAAFLDRRQDDTGSGKYTLANTTDPNSGPNVVGIQENINNLIQNFHFILYSLTHKKISYASGLLTFLENLVLASPDYGVINTISVAGTINLADGQSVYCTLSRYSTATIGYTITSSVPKGKDIFILCTRVGGAVIFWPNTLILDGNSARLGEGTQTPFVVLSEFLTKVLPNNPTDYSWALSNTPVTSESIFLFTDNDLEYDEAISGSPPYTISGNIVTFTAASAPPPNVIPFAKYFINGNASSPAPVTGATNLGVGGVGLFDDNNAGTLEFKSLIAAAGATVTDLGNGNVAIGASGGTYVPNGSESSPVTVIASAGITPTANNLQTWFIKGVTSSGAATVTANPQIAAGTTVGQRIALSNMNGTDYPVFNDLNGLSLNGVWPPVTAPLYARLELEWTGARWNECSRK